MKARDTKLPIPEGRNFWAVNLGTEEETRLCHFRFPRYTVAYGVKSLEAAGAQQAVDSGDLYGLLAGQMRTWAAAIGVCWWNRMAVLESEPTGLTAKELARYAALVEAELQERYGREEIGAMGKRAMEEINKGLGIVNLAAKRAKDFKAAEESDGPPPQANAEPSSPERSST